ncbi:Hypothetical predicted protein [Cloeon dipterum]|uniref:Uncharacterized protein n=1 Tax=Cloeon dipterum TaxID=197152 RepID=A0A8S1DAD5_9INSE|nr:Hypothetical predicted protein [Cloeon dipterum]
MDNNENKTNEQQFSKNSYVEFFHLLSNPLAAIFWGVVSFSGVVSHNFQYIFSIRVNPFSLQNPKSRQETCPAEKKSNATVEEGVVKSSRHSEMHPLGRGLSEAGFTLGDGDNSRLDDAILDHSRRFHRKKLICLSPALAVALFAEKIWWICTTWLPVLVAAEFAGHLHPLSPNLLPLLDVGMLVFPVRILIQWIIYWYLQNGAFVEIESIFPACREGMGDAKRFVQQSLISSLFDKINWHTRLAISAAVIYLCYSMSNGRIFYMPCTPSIMQIIAAGFTSGLFYSSFCGKVFTINALAISLPLELEKDTSTFFLIVCHYFLIVPFLVSLIYKTKTIFKIPLSPVQLFAAMCGRFGWNDPLEAYAFIHFFVVWLSKTGIRKSNFAGEQFTVC